MRYEYVQHDPELFPGFYESVLMPVEGAIRSNEEYSIYIQNRSEEVVDIWNKGLELAGLNKIIPSLIIKNVISPAEFNFEEDTLTCLCNLNAKSLLDFIVEHKEDFQQYLYDTWQTRSGFISCVPYEKWQWDTFLKWKGHKNIMIDYMILKYAIPAYETESGKPIDVELYQHTLEYPYWELHCEI